MHSNSEISEPNELVNAGRAWRIGPRNFAEASLVPWHRFPKNYQDISNIVTTELERFSYALKLVVWTVTAFALGVVPARARGLLALALQGLARRL